MGIHGDSLEVLKTLDDNSVDSIITDPPYGLSFMGKHWDYDVPSQEIWEECLRVLKPGGHLLSFGGSRTYHRMAVAIEDAGFEIRDQIMWVYGSGFPKSLNIGKAVDKLQGNEREVVGTQKLGGNAAQSTKEKGGTYASNTNAVGVKPIDVELTKGTSKWEGWGTALKPAHEPIVVARKPLEGTVASNVLKWGVGGLNIDESRVGTGTGEEVEYKVSDMRGGNYGQDKEAYADRDKLTRTRIDQGRFPANFIHDGSDEVVGLFPQTGKSSGGRIGCKDTGTVTVKNAPIGRYVKGNPGFGDSGSAARFFYCAKASKSERNKGLDEFGDIKKGSNFGNNGPRPHTKPDYKYEAITKNNHPTVKPVKLMQYLVKLVTPKGGTVLDPFMGSGTTGIACKLEGMDFIGIEREEDYIKIAEARIEAWEPERQVALWE